MPTIDPRSGRAKTISREVVKHVSDYWDDREVDVMAWTLEPFPSEFPHMRVVVSPPAVDGENWAYVSAGACVGDVKQRHGHEFVLHSPVEEPLHVELMADLARRQADPRIVPIIHGSVVEIGEPWMTDATCDHLFFGRPYSYPEEFEYLELDELTVHFLWAIPITAAEAEFCREHGSESFEDVLEESRADLVDPGRASIVG